MGRGAVTTMVGERRDESLETRRPVIGVDIDGVLGDQIKAISPVVEARFGYPLLTEHVTTYSHPIEDTHLGRLLWTAMDDPEFVRAMPVHAGAEMMLQELRQLGEILIITARPAAADAVTRGWLTENSLHFDRFMLGEMAKKSVAGSDILIDDYSGNLAEYLDNTEGNGVLVERPWNVNDLEPVAEHLSSGRLQIASSLAEVPKIVSRFVA